MTISTSFRTGTCSVPSERAEARVALPTPAPDTGAESREGDRLQVTEAGHEGERGDDHRTHRHEQRGRQTRAPASERTPNELERSRSAEQAAHSSPGGLLRIGENDA
jgi:hypothetical protein